MKLLQPGEVIDGFEMEECLHAGGMAHIYQVRYAADAQGLRRDPVGRLRPGSVSRLAGATSIGGGGVLAGAVGRQVGVVDKPVHDDVVGALEVLGLGERGFTVVKFTARGEYILKLKICIVIYNGVFFLNTKNVMTFISEFRIGFNMKKQMSFSG